MDVRKIKDADRIGILRIQAQPTKMLQARAALVGGFRPETPGEVALLESFRDAPESEVGKFGRYAYENGMELYRQAQIARQRKEQPAFRLNVFDIFDEMMMPPGVDAESCLALMNDSLANKGEAMDALSDARSVGTSEVVKTVVDSVADAPLDEVIHEFVPITADAAAASVATVEAPEALTLSSDEGDEDQTPTPVSAPVEAAPTENGSANGEIEFCHDKLTDLNDPDQPNDDAVRAEEVCFG